MNSVLFITIAVTGLIVAFFHAAIPTHWLPFVLVARARGWSRTRALWVAMFAGLGHVLLTSLLGLLTAWFGFKLNEKASRQFPWIIGSVLMIIGLFYLWLHFRRRKPLHHHGPGSPSQYRHECGHSHWGQWGQRLKDSNLAATGKSEWAVITGLFFMLALLPCEALFPIYFSGVQFGWFGFLVLSAILAVSALAGTLVFTWLTLAGLQRFSIEHFEKNEAAWLGATFFVLGALAIVIERGH